MKDNDRWDESDWDWIGTVEFSPLPIQLGSIIMVILLGGIILGLAAAIWHLAG